MIPNRQITWFLFSLLLAAGCKEPFVPEINPEQTNFLVVEGFINAEGSTIIRLSRTTQLKDTTKIKAELNAVVTVIGEDNSVYDIKENGQGVYSSDTFNLNKNQKYRLRIYTTGGKEYLSDFVPVKQTPAIDSLGWMSENNGVRIYINTHDQQNNTRYYKWEYEETWEIHSAYQSNYKYENGIVLHRDPNETSKLFYCWRSKNSTNILLGSSAQLNDDVISMAPILFIPQASEKISVRYSILVKQYALDRQAYDFFQLMKKNTESIGSIFDSQPSVITGNIVCVSNPAEKVIGYINASIVEQKRIFISRAELPAWDYHFQCESVFVENNPDSFAKYFVRHLYIPYEIKGFIQGYYASSSVCIECTQRGSNVKPAFW
ncbi:MAG: DUF4249 domain-containing protein [Bacteroidota bacterium]|nr:DUF4249 domain-containing protein [Bacteroidota bacterium]